MCSAWPHNLSNVLWSDWMSTSKQLMLAQPHHICASRFLEAKKDWFNAWLCLKSRQTGFGSPILFAVFQIVFYSFWISGHSWYLGLFESWVGDSAECQQSERKIKDDTLYILKEFTLKSTCFFKCPLASEEIEHSLKTKTFIGKVWPHEKEQSGKHYVFLIVLYWQWWEVSWRQWQLSMFYVFWYSHGLGSLVW